MKASSAVITGTSPSTVTTAVVGTPVTGLLNYSEFTIHANLLGGTGGTLNCRLQRQIAKDVWSDWVSFPQLAAGAPAISYAVESFPLTTIQTVGGGTDAIPTAVLTAGQILGGHPGDSVRLVCTTGAATSAGAAQTIYIIGRK